MKRPKPREIKEFVDTFIVKDNVRYIVDEEADLRQLSYVLRKREERAARDRTSEMIIDFCLGLLAEYPCDAQTITETLHRTGARVEIKDVRWAMKSARARELFVREQVLGGRIEFRLKIDERVRGTE